MLTAFAAAAAIGFTIGGLCVAIFWRERLLGDQFRWLNERLEILKWVDHQVDLAHGPRRHRHNRGDLDSGGSGRSTRDVGFCVVVGVAGLGLICGSATFSTLLPSAPGYVGSLQAAFVLAFSALGVEPVLGLLSATTTQLILLGPLTAIGLLMLFATHVHGAVSLIRRRTQRERTS